VQQLLYVAASACLTYLLSERKGMGTLA